MHTHMAEWLTEWVGCVKISWLKYVENCGSRYGLCWFTFPFVFSYLVNFDECYMITAKWVMPWIYYHIDALYLKEGWSSL